MAAVIDSQLDTATLLQYMTEKEPSSVTLSDDDNHNQLQFWPNATVRNVMELESHAVVEFESGQTVHCRHVVMAMGGLLPTLPLLDPRLLKPCYSYLVHVPIQTNNIDAEDDNKPNATNTTTTATTTPTSCHYSPNFFTWGFTHDW